jgi:methionine-rich copper-binding protein CopC
MRKRLYGLAFTVVATLYANVASAHAVLVSSNPANGSILSQPPKEIRLSFNEAIETRFSSVRLTRSGGKKVQTGGSSSDAQKRSDLVVPLAPLPPGKYQVRWQATSADSHRIQESFGFEITP